MVGELGFTSTSPSPPHSSQHPTCSPTPAIKRPHQLHVGSCSPHPGSGAWGCSTGPDYRCSGSCPPDGSRGHIGNPPGLHPELGGPHPSGKLSHFPGSSKTWSRFELWRDKKLRRKANWRLLPLRGQVWICVHKHPALQKTRCQEDLHPCLPLLPYPEASTQSQNKK